MQYLDPATYSYVPLPQDAAALVLLREEARKGRNWSEADRLRDELYKLGWTISDTKAGPKIRKASA